LAIGLAVAIAMGPGSGLAATLYWQGPDNAGADGNWQTASNWSTNTVPASADTVNIGNSTSGHPGTGTSTIHTGVLGTTGNMTLGNNLGDTGTLNVYGNLTDTSTAILIGNSGVGVLNVFSGGSVNMSAASSSIPVKLGATSTGAGTINLYAGGTISITRAVGLTVGYLGGSGATGMINQTGGSFVTTTGALLVESGSYNLAGGTLYSAGAETVGFLAPASFTQGGTTINTFVNGLTVGYTTGAKGTYSLLGGSLLGWQLNGATTPPFFYINVGSNGGTGTFYMGDANGTGTIGETGTGTRQVGLIVRVDSTSAGTFRGWGNVGLGGALINNGIVIADGYGTDRTLDMSTFSSVDLNGTQTITNTTNNGWFAKNHGKLVLPSLSVTADGNYAWGGVGGLNSVNNVQMDFHSVSTPGSLSVALLSADRTDVPTGLTSVIGVWQFTPTSLQFGSVDLTFRYDDAAAAALSVDPNTLNLYHYDGTNWVLVGGTTIDTTNKLLTATGLTSFSEYAIAVPEPATMTLLVMGGLSLLLRRRRDH
jgi:hypothetical protein